MKYRTLGRSGLKVSEISLGTVKFGAPVTDPECCRILDTAIDAGINLIDTAFVYGRSEEIIGAALRQNGKRDSVYLATKITPMQNDRNSILTQCNQSLSRLKTDHIDLLQLHRPSPDIPMEETLRALAELIRAGKVRYIGTSSYKAWQIMEALHLSRELGLHRFVSEQSVYSLLSRRIEDELMPLAQTYGIGLLLWSPLGAGTLTNKYSRENPPRHIQLTDEAWKVIATVRQLADKKGCTPSQLAFAWCLAQPGVTSPIAGPSSTGQLLDNLGALSVVLEKEDLDLLDTVAPRGWSARREWIDAEFSRPHPYGW